MRRGWASAALALVALPVAVAVPSPALAAGAPGTLAVGVLANGIPAAAAPGPEVEAGSSVSWVYEVTNQCATDLWALYVWHNGVGQADCPNRTLAPGETLRCSGTSTAGLGTRSRAVTARAWDAAGAEATGWSRAVYTGVVPPPVAGIDLETFVDGLDADRPPGPFIVPGTTVEFRYVVTNTGTLTLYGLWVSDNVFGTVPCPTRSLRPGQTATCLLERPAEAGAQHASASAKAWTAAGD